MAVCRAQGLSVEFKDLSYKGNTLILFIFDVTLVLGLLLLFVGVVLTVGCTLCSCSQNIFFKQASFNITKRQEMQRFFIVKNPLGPVSPLLFILKQGFKPQFNQLRCFPKNYLLTFSWNFLIQLPPSVRVFEFSQVHSIVVQNPNLKLIVQVYIIANNSV